MKVQQTLETGKVAGDATQARRPLEKAPAAPSPRHPSTRSPASAETAEPKSFLPRKRLRPKITLRGNPERTGWKVKSGLETSLQSCEGLSSVTDCGSYQRGINWAHKEARPLNCVGTARAGDSPFLRSCSGGKYWLDCKDSSWNSWATASL